MRGARCIRAQTDGGQLGGGAPRVVWLTLGANPKSVSAWSAAQRLNHEGRPPHLVWDPASGDVAQLLPIVRAGCALGTRENLDYAPDSPHSSAGVNREGRLCVQIAVLGTPREPFTGYHMIGLGEIMSWLDSWAIPRRWPAGPPAPFRQPAKPRSRALWALGGHFGASQVPDCDSIGPGGIDTDQICGAHAVSEELTGSARPGPSLADGPLARPRQPGTQPGDGALVPLSRDRSLAAARPSLSTAGV